jgi:hypothetical protein
LGLLQGCRSADAVAPLENPPVAPTAPLGPRNIRLASDTVMVGSVFVVTGEGFPQAVASVSASLSGVPLPVRALVAQRIELEVPRSFPCAAPVSVPLVLTVAGTSIERSVVLRTAERIELAVGQQQFARDGVNCLELGASDSLAGARFLLSAVNVAPDASTTAAYRMQGIGTGALAGVVSQIRGVDAHAGWRAPGAAVGPAPFVAGSDEPANHTALRSPEWAATPAGGVVAAWRVHSEPRGTRLRRALGVGDTTVVSATAASCHQGTAVRARVVYAGERVLVLEDMAASASASMNDALVTLGAEYDRVVYPLLVNNVGDPLAMSATMGSEPRATIVVTRFVNDSLPGTAGFVSACNFYPRRVFNASNESAVMFLRTLGRNETPSEWRRVIRSTVVHEGKHLASFAERMVAGRSFDEPWLEEATARVAEELYARTFTSGAAWRSGTGYEESIKCEVTACDDRPIIMWKHFTGLHTWLRSMATLRVGELSHGMSASTSNAAYAAGWALVRWVLDQPMIDERAALRRLATGQRGGSMAALASELHTDPTSMLGLWATGLGAALTVDGETGVRDGSAMASWRLGDIIRGMATSFPGVFSAQPLPLEQRSAGTFSVSRAVQGTASYTVLELSARHGGQLLQFAPDAPGTVVLSLRRLP